MIRVCFPSSQQTFVIEAPSIIESHLLEKYYQYARGISSNEYDDCSYYIKIANEKIILSNRSIGIKYEIPCRSDEIGFKKAISLLRENTILTGDFCVFHASFVQINRKGIMFLGESGAGKSTLAAFLQSKPACFCLSDDVTCINYRNMTVSGKSKYLYLRLPSMKLLPSGTLASYDSFLDRYKVAIPERETAGTVSAIIWLNRNKCKQPQIVSVNSSESILIHNVYFPYSLKNAFQASSVLSSQNLVYEMDYFDLEEAYNILNMFGA